MFLAYILKSFFQIGKGYLNSILLKYPFHFIVFPILYQFLINKRARSNNGSISCFQL